MRSKKLLLHLTCWREVNSCALSVECCQSTVGLTQIARLNTIGSSKGGSAHPTSSSSA